MLFEIPVKTLFHTHFLQGQKWLHDRDEPILHLPAMLTVREVSEYLRVHPTTVYRLLRAKQIPGFRVGGEWRFGGETIDHWRNGAEQAAVSSRHDKP